MDGSIRAHALKKKNHEISGYCLTPFHGARPLTASPCQNIDITESGGIVWNQVL